MAYLLWLALLAPDVSRLAVLPAIPAIPAIHHPAEPVGNRRARRRARAMMAL